MWCLEPKCKLLLDLGAVQWGHESMGGTPTTPTGGHSLVLREQPSAKPAAAPVSGCLIRQRGIVPCSFSNTTCTARLFLNTKPLESIGVSWATRNAPHGTGPLCSKEALARSLRMAMASQPACLPWKPAPTCTALGWGSLGAPQHAGSDVVGRAPGAAGRSCAPGGGVTRWEAAPGTCSSDSSHRELI